MMQYNEAAPEGAQTVTTIGEDVQKAVAGAAADLGVPTDAIRYEVDVSYFRNDGGGMVPRDDVRIIAWARDMGEVEIMVDSTGWVKTLLGHLEIEAVTTARLQGKTCRVVLSNVSDAGRLVGRRGRTVQGIEHMLNMAVGPDHEDFTFKIDIADKREREDRDDGERRERGDRDDRAPRGRDRDDRGGRGRDRDDRGGREDRAPRGRDDRAPRGRDDRGGRDGGRDRDDRGGRDGGRSRDRDDRGGRGGRGNDRDGEKLRRMAQKIIARVMETGKAERVRKELNGYDRRIIHLEAREHDGVDTRSIGDGSYKQIEFFPSGASVKGDGEE
ncbi:MAG: putative RNA-binding protein Jag [Cognaticolwellia sp.]|jgi:predicted RNA-binding protein Jag